MEFIHGSKKIATSFLEAKWEVHTLSPINHQHQLILIAGYFSRVGGCIKSGENVAFFQLFDFVFSPNLSPKSLFRLFQNIVLRRKKRECMTSPSIEISVNHDRDFCPSNFDLPVYKVF